MANGSRALIFTPHLLPINRGILSTIYVRLKKGVARQDASAWRGAFEDARWCVFADVQMPEVKFVANTPFCDVGCAVDEATGQAIIVSALDNLLKGARRPGAPERQRRSDSTNVKAFVDISFVPQITAGRGTQISPGLMRPL